MKPNVLIVSANYYSDISKKLIDDGFTIGAHSIDHPKYSLLFNCDDCGEYKGLIYSKENRPELHKRYSDENNPVIITCLCDGIKFVHCGGKKHRPISDYYDVESDTIIHLA